MICPKCGEYITNGVTTLMWPPERNHIKYKCVCGWSVDAPVGATCDSGRHGLKDTPEHTRVRINRIKARLRAIDVQLHETDRALDEMLEALGGG